MSQEYQFQPLQMHHDISLEEKRQLNQKPQICFFLLNIFIFLPIWLFVLLPLTIIYHILEKLILLCCCKKNKQEENNDPVSLGLEQTEVPKNEREYDLILYGATGFTGNFAAEYLARNYILRSNASRVSSLVKSFFFSIFLFLKIF